MIQNRSTVRVGLASLVLLASLTLVGRAWGLADPVKIATGQIAGAVADEAAGVRVYKGIPFAAPPVGELRWKAPQPAASWPGVRACTEFGKAPIQPPGLGVRRESTSEDCLYLNVWTAAKSANEKRPVMVWIYGGAYYMGSGDRYDGTNLAKQGVVVLTVNYRLGPLGFFSHPAISKESGHDASGNYGLMDQIAALQWVQKNIAAFGGDPNNVTIFGESAGSGSVSSLVLSPLAKGLFHRAIMQSGTVATLLPHLRNEWYGMESAEAMGVRIARDLGVADGPDALSVLRDIDAQEILRVSSPSTQLAGVSTGNRFGPITDGYVIPNDPLDLLSQGKSHPVPILIGSNADEGVTFVSRYPEKTVTAYEAIMASVYGPDATAVKSLYPVKSDADFLPAMNKHMAHSRFSAGSRRMAVAQEQLGAPAYVYYFTRVRPGGEAHGAVHAAEIPYVFNRVAPARGRSAAEDDDVKLAGQMSAYWVNFAKTGDPNGPGLTPWPRFQSKSGDYLELGSEVKPGQHLLQAQLDLFDRITEQRRQHRDSGAAK